MGISKEEVAPLPASPTAHSLLVWRLENSHLVSTRTAVNTFRGELIGKYFLCGGGNLSELMTSSEQYSERFVADAAIHLQKQSLTKN